MQIDAALLTLTLQPAYLGLGLGLTEGVPVSPSPNESERVALGRSVFVGQGWICLEGVLVL